MIRAAILAAALVTTAAFWIPERAEAASGVHYDAHGKPYVTAQVNGKTVRVYCRTALYGEVRCPTRKHALRYGPYDRGFAFSQGYQILR